MPTSRAERRSAPTCGRRAAGFTYLGVLLAVALIGLALDGAAQIWSTRAARERFARLDAIGAEYVAAIAAYRQGTPGIVVQSFPPSLAALVRDPRFLTVRRYLRREYPDPFTGRVDWEAVAAPDGGVMGVRVRLMVDGQEMVRQYVYRTPASKTLRAGAPD